VGAFSISSQQNLFKINWLGGEFGGDTAHHLQKNPYKSIGAGQSMAGAKRTYNRRNDFPFVP
jgi:hypothetical protein